MSREEIDKAIYDPERYESLRDRGIDEDRAKRVATVPLSKEESQPAGRRKPAAARKPLAEAATRIAGCVPRARRRTEMRCAGRTGVHSSSQ